MGLQKIIVATIFGLSTICKLGIILGFVVVVIVVDVVVVVVVVVVVFDVRESTARLLRPKVADRKQALYDVVLQILTLRVCRFSVRA
jgi:hypothetical protein